MHFRLNMFFLWCFHILRPSFLLLAGAVIEAFIRLHEKGLIYQGMDLSSWSFFSGVLVAVQDFAATFRVFLVKNLKVAAIFLSILNTTYEPYMCLVCHLIESYYYFWWPLHLENSFSKRNPNHLLSKVMFLFLIELC